MNEIQRVSEVIWSSILFMNNSWSGPVSSRNFSLSHSQSTANLQSVLIVEIVLGGHTLWISLIYLSYTSQLLLQFCLLWNMPLFKTLLSIDLNKIYFDKCKILLTCRCSPWRKWSDVIMLHISVYQYNLSTFGVLKFSFPWYGLMLPIKKHVSDLFQLLSTPVMFN